MIKQIYVCECDICGVVVPAKAKNYRNETDYVIPDGWTHGKHTDICVCPACAAKLNIEPITKPVQNEFACVYGCPAVTYLGVSYTGSVTVDTLVLQTDTVSDCVCIDADSEVPTETENIHDHLRVIKNLCKHTDECEKCPLSHLDQHGEYTCHLRNCEVYYWNHIADNVKDNNQGLSVLLCEIARQCDRTYCCNCEYYANSDTDSCRLLKDNPEDWDIKEKE